MAGWCRSKYGLAQETDVTLNTVETCQTKPSPVQAMTAYNEMHCNAAQLGRLISAGLWQILS